MILPALRIAALLFAFTRVPPACSLAFAKAAQLKADHHFELPVGHYTAAFLLPTILTNISDLLHGVPLSNPPPGTAPAPAN